MTSPFDHVELLRTIPQADVPGTAEYSATAIVQYGRKFEVFPIVVQEPL